MADMNEFLTAVGSTFIWHEIYGANVDKSIEFYTKALGWGTEEMNMEGGATYKMLVANGKAVAGCWGTQDTPGMENVPPHWAVYIAVDDVDARLAKCQELGANLLHGPMDIPTVGRMALVQDPQGATFWLFKSVPM